MKCADLGSERSSVNVTYESRALSEAGRRFIAGFDETTYEFFIGEWEELLLRHFAEKG